MLPRCWHCKKVVWPWQASSWRQHTACLMAAIRAAHDCAALCVQLGCPWSVLDEPGVQSDGTG